jgi:tripartite-type tricarboxylate transporter receptor subunit TctC
MNFAFRAATALFVTGTLAASTAWAEYPDHSIQMIVPFTAGGPTDNVARALAETMGRIMHQSIIVENKGGAGGTIGTADVARSRPDGYELLLMHVGFTTAPSLYKNPGYDALKSFEPIGLVVDVPMTIIARKNFPPNTMAELASYVKEHKDKVTLANAGIGAASHLCSTMLISALGTELLTVPYKGTAPAMNDLLGGQVDMMCDQSTNTTQQIAAKTVKSYAVTSLTRIPTLPNLPTMDESGFKGFQVGIWHGMWAPKGTPKPVIDKLVAALQAGLKDPKFQQRMSALGATVLTADATPQALQAKVTQQVPQWAELFKKAGVQAQ